MLTAYRVHQDRLLGITVEPGNPLPDDSFWLDLVGGGPIARQQLSQLTGMPIPSAEAVEEIEATSRFFDDRHGIHLRTFFLCGVTDPAHQVTVAFILNPRFLITLRTGRLSAFDAVTEHPDRPPQAPTDVLLRLFEAQVDQVADTLEDIHADLETLNNEVFVQVNAIELDQAMRRLAAAQDLNDKVRLSLFDQQRALGFLGRTDCCDHPDHGHRLAGIERDIESLSSHSTFLFEKVGFLIDAIRGQINLQEAKILKLLSLMGAVLLPPTLIAAIYGMNFADMPELHWRFGYPLALGVMVVAAIVPVAVFKLKKWI